MCFKEFTIYIASKNLQQFTLLPTMYKRSKGPHLFLLDIIFIMYAF